MVVVVMVMVMVTMLMMMMVMIRLCTVRAREALPSFFYMLALLAQKNTTRFVQIHVTFTYGLNGSDKTLAMKTTTFCSVFLMRLQL